MAKNLKILVKCAKSCISHLPFFETVHHILTDNFGSDSYFSIIIFASVTVLVSADKNKAGFWAYFNKKIDNFLKTIVEKYEFCTFLDGFGYRIHILIIFFRNSQRIFNSIVLIE